MEALTNHLEWTSLLWALCSGNHGNSNRSFKPATSSHCSWIIKSFGAWSSGNHGSPNQSSWVNFSYLSIVLGTMETPTNHLEWTSLLWALCSGNHGNSNRSFKPATSSHCSWIIKSFGALSSGNQGSPNPSSWVNFSSLSIVLETMETPINHLEWTSLLWALCSGNYGNPKQSPWMNLLFFDHGVLLGALKYHAQNRLAPLSWWIPWSLGVRGLGTTSFSDSAWITENGSTTKLQPKIKL